jgi:hypothetical protein
VAAAAVAERTLLILVVQEGLEILQVEMAELVPELLEMVFREMVLAGLMVLAEAVEVEVS